MASSKMAACSAEQDAIAALDVAVRDRAGIREPLTSFCGTGSDGGSGE